MARGLFFSIITVLFWALEHVSLKVIVSHWPIEPAVFVCVNLLTASLVLLIIAGPGRLGLETIKQPHTWAYSLFSVLNNVFFVLAVGLISAAEASFIWRFNAVLTMIVVWFFIGRSTSVYDWIGTLIILGGCALIAAGFDPQIRDIALVIVFVGTLSMTLRTTVTEFHPTSNQSRTIKEQCRITGYVLLVTSAAFLLFILGMTYVSSSLTGRQDVFGMVAAYMPQRSDFFDPPTIWSAMLLGAFLTAIYNYCQFVATRTAKSEIFIMVTALVPFVTYAFELIASVLGYAPAPEMSTRSLTGGCLIGAGAIFIIYMRFHRARREKVTRAVA
ncbi:MAG: DMT family transporter [Gammaproteobacteria bacterium]